MLLYYIIFNHIVLKGAASLFSMLLTNMTSSFFSRKIGLCYSTLYSTLLHTFSPKQITHTHLSITKLIGCIGEYCSTVKNPSSEKSLVQRLCSVYRGCLKFSNIEGSFILIYLYFIWSLLFKSGHCFNVAMTKINTWYLTLLCVCLSYTYTDTITNTYGPVLSMGQHLFALCL